MISPDPAKGFLFLIYGAFTGISKVKLAGPNRIFKNSELTLKIGGRLCFIVAILLVRLEISIILSSTLCNIYC